MTTQSKLLPDQKTKRKPFKVRDLDSKKETKGGASAPSKIVPGSLQDFFKSESLPIDN